MGRRRTGSALQRRGKWIARITLHRDASLPSGEPRRIEIAITRSDGKTITPAYARDFARRAQSLYDETGVAPGCSEKSIDTPPKGIAVVEWVERWLKKQTYSEAVKDLARVRAWLPRTALATIPVADVTPRAIAAWLAEMRRMHSARGQLPAPRTIRNVADPVARALRAAVFDEVLVADPFAALPTACRPQSIDADPAARKDYRLSRTEVESVLGAMPVS